MSTAALTRSFVPENLDCSKFDELEPLYQTLLDRQIGSPADLEQWLLDYSELSAVVSEYGSRRNIDYACHTDDKDIEAAYMHFIENVAPRIKPFGFELQRKYLESGFADDLIDPKYKLLTRQWQQEVDLYREENVSLQTQIAKTAKEYDKLCGEMLVEYEGKQRTLQQMTRFQQETDQAVRQETWELVEKRRATDAQAMNDIFDQLIKLRHEMATNAGFKNFRDYQFANFHRFDYTPEDCHAFADAIESKCMPLVKKLNEERRNELGLEKLRPWDLSVDPKGRAPLRPFAEDNVEDLIINCGRIFQRLSPSLAEDFATMEMGRNLDLQSRKGKRPGGFQSSLLESKQPFIFMNAAGLHRDVETMLHEAGHAFHYMWCNHEPILFVQHAPIEFCEVASMAMELFADPHMDVFYEGDEISRAVGEHLEGIIRFFPWMATIDQFQHWIYENPEHSQADRRDAWQRINGRFSDDSIDWSGYELYRDTRWQRQIHLYHYPFYYVEYGIAQLGALQLWLQSRDDVEKALANYRNGLKLGGTRPLPELFAASGIDFDFSEKTFGPLIDAVEHELSEIA